MSALAPYSSLPLIVCRYVSAPPGSDTSRQYITTDADLGVYFRPDTGGKMLVGSLEPECDPLKWVDAPDKMDVSLSDQWTAHVYRAALRIPSLQIPRVQETKVRVRESMRVRVRV